MLYEWILRSASFQLAIVRFLKYLLSERPTIKYEYISVLVDSDAVSVRLYPYLCATTGVNAKGKH